MSSPPGWRSRRQSCLSCSGTGSEGTSWSEGAPPEKRRPTTASRAEVRKLRGKFIDGQILCDFFGGSCLRSVALLGADEWVVVVGYVGSWFGVSRCVEPPPLLLVAPLRHAELCGAERQTSPHSHTLAPGTHQLLPTFLGHMPNIFLGHMPNNFLGDTPDTFSKSTPAPMFNQANN